VRDVADLEALAAGDGLALREIVEMPANNLILVFARENA
jgi:predicted membrane-bound spermidine synthase